ncbi:hypothetical protein K0H59_07215 [Shewanella sp. FJAT-51649]|uniref:hypothetical protein n=1 Tax=Shewanella sp. FJAT-51649 TaxID=2864210 RepID=UPI001C65539F|nr:hypothetical protein [Shewanella sp. FJAT-51649]QYJ72809.1 hypothetical protein K0H59_07215 [Shewanella sp. FJAT-51649]
MPQELVYCIYGINVATSLPLPALKSPLPAEVSILRGSAPDILSAAFSANQKLQFDGHRVLLNQPLFGKLLIEKPGNITLDFNPSLSQAHTITALQGSGLGTLLHLRKQIPLHGMAIATDKGAIVVLADSGSGKSTLATAMLLANLSVFTDDIVALQSDKNGVLQIQPAHRRLKLSQSQLHTLGIDTSMLSNTAPGIEKIGWDIPEAQFAAVPMPIIKCLFLEPVKTNSANAHITAIGKLEAFQRLLQSVYRPRLIRVFDHEQSFFTLNQQLQHQCQSYTMQLPDLGHFPSLSDYGKAIANQLLSL